MNLSDATKQRANTNSDFNQLVTYYLSNNIHHCVGKKVNYEIMIDGNNIKLDRHPPVLGTHIGFIGENLWMVE